MEKSLVLKEKLKKYLRLRNILLGVVAVILVIVGIEIQDKVHKSGNFRTMQDPLLAEENVNLTGLRELPFAGGPVPIFSNVIEKLPSNKTLFVVDGLVNKVGYINGVPGCILGYGRFPLFGDMLWRLFYTQTAFAHPELTTSEEAEAKKFNMKYIPLRIVSKGSSSDNTIDTFVEFIDNLPKDAYVYFHCENGKGRTSMMLVMADILKNAPQVSLKDIVERQHLLGSVDMFDTIPWRKGTYGKAMLQNRKRYIEKFYEFVCQRKAGGLTRWSDWRKQDGFKDVADF